MPLCLPRASLPHLSHDLVVCGVRCTLLRIPIARAERNILIVQWLPPLPSSLPLPLDIMIDRQVEEQNWLCGLVALMAMAALEEASDEEEEEEEEEVQRLVTCIVITYNMFYRYLVLN